MGNSNSSLLHKNKLEDFKKWLIWRGEELLPTKGKYQVLCWKGESSEVMPVVSDRQEGQHLTLSHSAARYVRAYISERKKLTADQYDSKLRRDVRKSFE